MVLRVEITKSDMLLQQGRYSEAVKVTQKALKVAEKTFGINHPAVGISLNNLAESYRAQGKYSEVEPLYKRALGIVEKALGPDHPDVATVLDNMAKCYRETGKKGEAEKLEARAKKSDLIGNLNRLSREKRTRHYETV